eukprot:10308312-Karenia_brevis.AAC.1
MAAQWPHNGRRMAAQWHSPFTGGARFRPSTSRRLQLMYKPLMQHHVNLCLFQGLPRLCNRFSWGAELRP